MLNLLLLIYHDEPCVKFLSFILFEEAPVKIDKTLEIQMILIDVVIKYIIILVDLAFNQNMTTVRENVRFYRKQFSNLTKFNNKNRVPRTKKIQRITIIYQYYFISTRRSWIIFTYNVQRTKRKKCKIEFFFFENFVF